ncbi:MAG TPA: cytochrome c oxidase assembly protein [Gaiellaceae bacterium]|nr:cytochrome c oxidase assembly protein [Gaiellaceae bacterium]
MVPISQLSTAWDPAPLVLAAAAVAALRFAYAFLRLRRRGRFDHAGWDRAALFGAGIALLTLPLVSPLDAAGDDYLLSAHMLQHVLIGDAGPALILVAVRGPLLAFMLPPAAVRFVFRNRPVHAFVAWISRPLPTLGLWVAALGAWHVPRLYDGALRHPWAHDLEHASFVSAGILVWMQLVDPARTGRLTVGKRVAFAGAVFLLGQVLSDVLFLTSTPLYPAYADRAVRLFGLSPLADQQYAGLVMMAEQILTLGTCVAILGASALRPASRPARLAPI